MRDVAKNQNTFTIIARINPGDLQPLEQVLGAIGQSVEDNEYIRFGKIETLHMAGISVAATDARFPPVLIFESNFDGAASDYVRALVSHGRPGLDAIYEKCEGYPPADERSDDSVAAYLHKHAVPAAAFFVGLPGQSVASIRNAIAVRQEINRFLDTDEVKRSVRGMSAREVRDLIVHHLSNDSPVKPEIPPATFSSHSQIASRNTLIAGIAGAAVALATLPLLIIWALAIRYLEIRDKGAEPQPDPPPDERTYATEDLFTQNHLATIGVVKNNPIRRFTIRAAVAMVGIMFQKILLRGGFGGVFTLHFAHVVWLDGGQRILLLTGYDGSALEYIGNFTDTAGYYLNGAYGNVHNYPLCRWLVFGGASSATGFADWARQHMQYTPIFYSAYPQETVLNLKKDLDIRDHLTSAASDAEVERLLGLL